MPLGNQYGIDLGNIYETASSLKTAQQLQEKRQRDLDTEAEASKAEKGYLQKQRPGTTATSIEQQSEFDKLDTATQQKALSDARKTIEQHGKVALFASTLPPEQQAPYIEQYVSTLPEREQAAFNQKYTGDLVQQIPYMINDLMTTDQLLKEREAKIKHEQALEEEGVKGAIRYGEQELKGRQAQERTETSVEGGIKREGIKQSGISSRGGGKGNAYKPKLLSYEIKTKTDPKTGDKTTVRINKYDDGSVTTTEGLKPPPPLETQKPKGATYNPKDVVRYGTKNGKRVAQMKDGSVIYVK